MAQVKEFFIIINKNTAQFDKSASAYYNTINRTNEELGAEYKRLLRFHSTYTIGDIHASIDVYGGGIDDPKGHPTTKLVIWKKYDELYVDDTIGELPIVGRFEYEINGEKYVIHTSFATEAKVLDRAQQIITMLGFNLGVIGGAFAVSEADETDEYRSIVDNRYETLGELLEDAVAGETEDMSSNDQAFLQDGVVDNILENIRVGNVMLDGGWFKYKNHPYEMTKYEGFSAAWRNIYNVGDMQDKDIVATLNFLRGKMEECRPKVELESAAGYFYPEQIRELPDIVQVESA